MAIETLSRFYRLRARLAVVHETFHRPGIERSKELENTVPVARFDVWGRSVNEIIRGSDGVAVFNEDGPLLGPDRCGYQWSCP